MKRTLILFSFLLFSVWAQAQTQQGYVKTLGRPDKAGEPLGGVSVRVKGGHNEVLSGSDGTFEMRMDGKRNGEAYALQSVQKAGYELNENDIIGRQFAFSDKVRLEIVMVSSSVLQAEKRRIEDNAYKTAEKNYKAKAEALEQQLQDSAISIQQYRERMAELQDKFEKYQSLIDGLAEHYAHTDYDMLSETDREINICIENGELERADSLINTLFDPIGVLERNMNALARIEQQIGQAHEMIEQANDAMAAVLKQQEKDAEYLYQLYTIALAKLDLDKAIEYIVTRAELDTTNVDWQMEAAVCAHNQRAFRISEAYFFRAYALYQNADNQKEGQWAKVLNDLGVFFFDTRRFDKSEAAYLEAMSIASESATDGNLYYHDLLARTQNNIADLYYTQQRFSDSEEAYKQALKIRRKLSESHNPLFELNLATTLNDLAGLYSRLQRYTESEAMYLESINIYERIADLNNNQGNLAIAYSNLALLYRDTQRLSESETYQLKALNIQRSLAKENPQAYMPDVAETLRFLANLYLGTEQYQDAESCFVEALAIQRQLANDYPQIYNESLSITLTGLADLYSYTQREHESEKLYEEAISIQRQLAKEHPEAFESHLAATLASLASFYSRTQRYAESELMYKESLDIVRRLAKAQPEVFSLALSLIGHRLGVLYFEMERFTESQKLLIEALGTERNFATTNPSEYEMNLAESLYYLGMISILNDNYSDAISYLKESLEIYKRIKNEDAYLRSYYHDVLENLVQLHFATADYSSAFQCNQELIESIENLEPTEKAFYQESLGIAHNNQSYYCLLMKKFKESEQHARDAIILEPSAHVPYTNLAASLLFQGKYAEAEEIYRNMKLELKDTFLQDLAEFEAAGVIPEERKADVERIRKMLTEE